MGQKSAKIKPWQNWIKPVIKPGKTMQSHRVMHVEDGRVKHREREGGRERGKEGGREGGKEREGGREGERGRERGRERKRGREREREGGRERGRERESRNYGLCQVCFALIKDERASKILPSPQEWS